VQFIIRHDKTNSLKFASLQSETGRRLVRQYHIPATVDSVVFIENGKVFVKAAAAFQMLNYFSGAWKLFRLFAVLPSGLNNFFYNIVARNRYKWFGRKESCMLPSPELSGRFLDL
jgi:predicted DCC family thiol-disulfide oxidoreductase YuxK